jgi:hypothetical protein
MARLTVAAKRRKQVERVFYGWKKTHAGRKRVMDYYGPLFRGMVRLINRAYQQGLDDAETPKVTGP